MKLPFLEFGEPDDLPVVLVHGLFGQGKNLSNIARALSTDRYVIAVDLRNHGDAKWADVHDYFSLAGDLFETFEHYPQIDIMGHSMGGKASMMLALKHPDFVRKLLVADMSPAPYTHDHSEHIDAMMGVDLTVVKTRREADALLKIEDDGIRAFLLHGLKFEDNPRWQHNLAVLKKEMLNIVGWPVMSEMFKGPTLFVGGANSFYITKDHRDAINAAFPEAKITHIKNAGHWLHVEQPTIFAQIICDFFKL